MDSEVLYEKLIFENLEKNYQYRLVLSEFKDVEYLHLRKYFQSYEGEYIPSSEGAAIPATISNIFALLDALIEICSKAEASEAINRYFADKLESLAKP